MASKSLENNKSNTVCVGRASCWRVLCYRVVSVACSLVVTCWERADLLAVMFVVSCHFPGCVLFRIAVMGEVGGVRLGWPFWWGAFTDCSKTVPLFWIICVFCVLCFSCLRFCSLLPCGHLLGKGWPIGSCW